MNTYQVESLISCLCIVETSPDGRKDVVRTFPTLLDARKWIEDPKARGQYEAAVSTGVTERI